MRHLFGFVLVFVLSACGSNGFKKSEKYQNEVFSFNISSSFTPVKNKDAYLGFMMFEQGMFFSDEFKLMEIFSFDTTQKLGFPFVISTIRITGSSPDYIGMKEKTHAAFIRQLDINNKHAMAALYEKLDKYPAEIVDTLNGYIFSHRKLSFGAFKEIHQYNASFASMGNIATIQINTLPEHKSQALEEFTKMINSFEKTSLKK